MKTIYLINLLMLSSFYLVAQESQPAPRSSIDANELNNDPTNEVKKFRELGGIGLGIVSFRDLATSPLIYRGSALSLRSGISRISSHVESKYGIDVLLGGAFSSVDKENSLGVIITTDINYSRFYNLKSLAFKGWQTKVGGFGSTLFVNRINPDLRNNAVGFEIFSSLFGSLKILKDFTRHLPLRKKKGSRDQRFSFRLDVGLINVNFRNGYAYTAHSPFYNGSNVFENHQLNWFSGFRIRSVVDYILYAKTTKNAIKLSYNWAGVLSGENPDQFAMSSGLISFSYLYRVK